MQKSRVVKNADASAYRSGKLKKNAKVFTRLPNIPQWPPTRISKEQGLRTIDICQADRRCRKIRHLVANRKLGVEVICDAIITQAVRNPDQSRCPPWKSDSE